jgi:hypothetical protein
MANLHRLLLAAALTLVASLAVASSASAAPGNGADVVRQNECSSYPGFGTYCIDAKYVQKSTETPSGNLSFFANGESALKFTGEGYFQGCKGSSSDEFNYHYLFKDGVGHESGSHVTGEFSVDCFGYQYDCTYSYDIHYANGRLQFFRPEINCNP